MHVPHPGDAEQTNRAEAVTEDVGEGALFDHAVATEVDTPQSALAGATGEAWRARPVLATTIRLVALCAPVALSLAAVYGLSGAVGAPSGTRALTVGWWVGLSGVATLSLVVAGRVVRRLLPLGALLRLSLVFPDGAPSRFRMALRTGTVDTLEERLAEARRGVANRTPVESAQLLLELVADLDEHDPLTRGHSERVRAYAQSIGRELGLDRRELDLLNWAALLHDVGKLTVPHEILTKSGPPTDGEWAALHAHPAAGLELTAPLAGWLGEWSSAIGEHHERWDGRGYPLGLAGEEISRAGRIVAVADVFDVITSTRSYKRPASVASARREILRCAGTQFDPDVVRAFLAISVRQSRLAAPFAWLAQATALARLPFTQAASGLSVGAAAVAVGMGAGPATYAAPSQDVAQGRAPVYPAARATVAQPRHSSDAHARSERARRQAAPPKATRAATPESRPPTRVPPAPEPASPAPPPSPSPAPGNVPSAPAAGAPLDRGPTRPPRAGVPDAPPPATPPPLPDVQTAVDDLTETLPPVTAAVTTVVDEVVPPPTTPPGSSPPPPSQPSPPPPPAPTPPPASPPPPVEPGSGAPTAAGSGGLLDGLLSLLTGLLPPGG
jgi:hypothetical protein